MNKKNVLPCTGGGGRAQQAFTMAEILLSLTIIGVVAAITLPSLTGNINERTWNTQRKALYARMSQAISLMPALNGYGTFSEETSSGAEDAVDTLAETFITSGLSKVLKINNICDAARITDCGISKKLVTMAGSTISVPVNMEELNSAMLVTPHTKNHPYNSSVAAFETVNGENILLYYNPRCTGENPQLGVDLSAEEWYQLDYAQEKMCANLIYDLNGLKGPNTVGKDIGVMTIFFPSDSVVVAPQLVSSRELLSHGGLHYSQLNSLCSDKFGGEYRALTKWEIASAWINRDIFGLTSSYGSLIATTSVLIPGMGMRPYRISWERGFLWVSSETDTGIASVFCEAR